MAEEMARRSTMFVDEMLTPCALEKYVVLLLKGYEAKAKMGSRPPREGMKRLQRQSLEYCNWRHNNHVGNALYTAGTLAANVRRPKVPMVPPPTMEPVLEAKGTKAEPAVEVDGSRTVVVQRRDSMGIILLICMAALAVMQMRTRIRN
eukprot:TRINITY_DN2139_c0_g1_i1.p2 TRINITY_DN2139_c0_g1~~TRINITY_DN2139_c0_g1_i1.p2  ORF type:complete len:173 (+),score=48.92 TRINITY_DN2139_c0_g1_i1:78-521(+)